MPLLRTECDLLICPPGVLPVAHPLWYRRGAQLGTSCWFEQRYWHDSLREDGRRARDNEQRRGVWDRLRILYSLLPDSVTRPLDAEGTPQTVVLSTQCLLAWLLHKLEVCVRKDEVTKAHEVVSLFRRAVECAAVALSGLPDADLPEISCGNGRLYYHGDGRMQVSSLIDRDLPDLQSDWDVVREHAPELALPRFDHRSVRLADWLFFLDTRCRWSEAQPDDFLCSMRAACLSVVSFLIEFQVLQEIATDDGKERLRVPSVLLTRAGKRRQRFAVLTKLDLIEKISGDGSSNAVSDALSLTRGLSSLIASIENDSYTAMAAPHLSGSWSVALHWDQSTHGGHDINIGMVLDCNSDRGAYMRPAATSEEITGFIMGIPMWIALGKCVETCRVESNYEKMCVVHRWRLQLVQINGKNISRT